MSSPAPRPTPVIPDWSSADRLRKVRRDVLGLEQTEMAARLDVTRQAYQSWETGRSAPRDIVAVAKRIEMLSGVPAAWVLGIEPNGQGPAPTNQCTSDRYRRAIVGEPQVSNVVSLHPSGRFDLPDCA